MVTPQFHGREVLPTDYAYLTTLIAAIESVADAVPRVAAKAHQRLLFFRQVPAHTAMLLKQELLALAGDALVTPEVYLGQTTAATPLLGWASDRAWRAVVNKFNLLPLDDCRHIAAEIASIVDINKSESLTVAGHTWHWGQRTFVMGIVNMTPDSFSQDGLLRSETPALVATVEACVAAGADWIDVGGESTRPGSAEVEAAEEIARVIPMVQAATQFNLPISIDTYKAEVADAALAAGAHIVNDIWGLRTSDGGWNTALAQLVAARDVPIILMHNRRALVQQTKLGGHFTAVEYADLVGDVCADLQASIQFALESGIRAEQIILDPGVGFGKTPVQNIELLQRLAEIRSLGYPLLVGTSRKSFIGLAIQAPVTERVFGTAATVTHAIMHGADIVRVHDVAAMVDVCRMTDSLVRSGAWEHFTQKES